MALPDDLTRCSDEELLACFQNGEQEAFGALVRRYEGELYGYLRRYLGDGALAEDVFQNTFLQVFTKIRQYEKGRPVKPWLYAIATNQAIDALRRAGRQSMLSLDQESEEARGDELGRLLSVFEQRGAGPLEQIQGEERRQLVRAGVERLPEFLRQVIILAYYQGLKYQEIADILAIPVGTVKSRMHTALCRLQEAWSGSEALHGL
ncbi:MAG: sigma-70 family RNA polymerase sigma factor [Gemmataceae bacterium]